MKSRVASVLLVAATLVSGVVSAGSTGKQQTVRLDRDTVVGSTTLPRGTYRLNVAAGLTTATFVQGKHTVAEAPCKVEVVQAVYPDTAVHYRNGVGGPDRLIKIVFSGSNLAVEFETGPSDAGDASVADAAGRR
jgi:hypothetical protein